MRTVIIYDDTGKKSEVITDIIGEKRFADVVVKRRCLEEYYRDELEKLFPNLFWKKIHSIFEYEDVVKELELYNSKDTKIMHCFSNYLIADAERAALSFNKLSFIDEPFGVLAGKKAVAAMFPEVENYILFCRSILTGQRAWDLVRGFKEHFEIEGVVDIGLIGNFIQCITGHFDSRYFNSLKGNEYTIVKSSSNKAKIKAEYSFYHLLPEDMKFWFVLPFNYQEDMHTASYTMERLQMTDLAIKWVHGSMDEVEFEELMDKYFYFFKSRHIKKCSEEEYVKISNALYIDKVNERIAELKKNPAYRTIKNLLDISEDGGIDGLVIKYLELKDKIESNVNYPMQLAIGHGDPCFANALYNKFTKTLKFIDPKGAVTEKELWTNPYYDVAKLSLNYSSTSRSRCLAPLSYSIICTFNISLNK